MIQVAQGNLLTADAEALVNTVNCVGVMGRGIALQFKDAYPSNFEDYAIACAAGEVVPGKMHVHTTNQLTNPRFIINFPTKRHWRGNSRLEDIEAGLIDLRSVIVERRIQSIALPPLGSGLGGLPWPAVKARIIHALGDLELVKVILFEPLPDADKIKRQRKKAGPTLSPLRAALVSLIDRYMRGLMEPNITLLELHKLAYFLQSGGLNMRLRFQKAHYGPYAENLRHVLNDMEGYYTAGYGFGGDQPDKKIEIVPGALEAAQLVIEADKETAITFGRIDELVRGFETPLGLELLATTHWAIWQEGARNSTDVRDVFGLWSKRKSNFTQRQIDIAFERLESGGWLPPS
ncbi:macro domain-containing protein [Erythrobacter sp. HL-111]|uniref:type II toxin-antitoxin system antitoxin DNA ADP-ribosyl glycohydrolase DarG n=1 Tax=Erythrobacter sp. HL-111 TaxID=1798193 RepID=UPI0006D96A6B|nr:macro domain-containing protein [Erythrobacter sp. HL-111]KPP87964.1 MAG: putative phosphatase homologous to the C-terminal domain of histone macroH2A1 [Erythrobacteraceae bacterium HL-111]SDS43186.1 O-acetyl-ADP-ribose deacetylase (regulator of RNase III), contains Macro domain [Erythrobacter sp. HL-111]